MARLPRNNSISYNYHDWKGAIRTGVDTQSIHMRSLHHCILNVPSCTQGACRDSI
jgi:hypothetical protein